MVRLIVIGTVFVLAFSAGSAASDQNQASLELRAVIAERLALMPDVARYKWNRSLPVEDLKREAEILRRTVARAQEEGLSEKEATKFIAAQMQASKHAQSALFLRWRKSSQGKFEGVPDLVTEIRPKIGALTKRLILAFKQSVPFLENCRFQDSLAAIPGGDASIAESTWDLASAGYFPKDSVARCQN